MVLTVVLSPAWLTMGGSVLWAARTARLGRTVRARLLWGAALAIIGLGVMALCAWSTREDVHYDDFGSSMVLLAGIIGGAVLLLGLGPFLPWLAGTLGRRAVRLPLPLRLAIRDVAGHRARSAAWMAVTMCATAVGVAVTVMAVARAAQDRAEYEPRARPGTLLVEHFSPERAPAVRAAIQRQSPGVPVVQRDDPEGYVELGVPGLSPLDIDIVTEPYIGGPDLLRYLTGSPATPYRPDTAVVVTTRDVAYPELEIGFGPPEDSTTRTIPAVTARPADSRIEGVFIPGGVVRDLGLAVEPQFLIVDPAFHRTSVPEQERLGERLDGTATVYVERGFQPSTGWRAAVAIAALVAVGGAVAATGRRIGATRPQRVLLRTSAARARLFVACRAGFGAACGGLPGAVAGGIGGWLLAWPMTASSDWEPVPRPPFDIPWPAIAACVAALPILAAVIAAAIWAGRVSRPAAPAAPSRHPSPAA